MFNVYFPVCVLDGVIVMRRSKKSISESDVLPVSCMCGFILLAWVRTLFRVSDLGAMISMSSRNLP